MLTFHAGLSYVRLSEKSISKMLTLPLRIISQNIRASYAATSALLCWPRLSSASYRIKMITMIVFSVAFIDVYLYCIWWWEQLLGSLGYSSVVSAWFNVLPVEVQCIQRDSLCLTWELKDGIDDCLPHREPPVGLVAVDWEGILQAVLLVESWSKHQVWALKCELSEFESTINVTL